MQSIVQQLDGPPKKTKWFVIHYGERNPRDRAGLGSHGVTSPQWVERQQNALAELEARFERLSHSRKFPQEPINVYVFDVAQTFISDFPITVPDDKSDTCYICLPSGNNVPMIEHALYRAEAEALHEGMHAINNTVRPLKDFYTTAWVWFDEATAVYFEIEVLGANPDSLMFGKDWIDSPETSLDSAAGQYQAGIFAHYLARCTDADFISYVWTRAERTETPVEALTRLLSERGHVLVSANPDVQDLFASGYCMDAYGPRFAALGRFEYALQERYGHRAVEHSLDVQCGTLRQCEGKLDHLACRYYRLYLPALFNTLRVALHLLGEREVAPLKVEVAPIAEDSATNRRWPLRNPPHPGADASSHLELELSCQDIPTCDHLVVVVTNCGTRPDRGRRNVEHDDAIEYQLDHR
jgi:hypothetical protein